MSLADLTADAVRQAIAEFDRLGRDAFLSTYGFGQARGYFLVHNGQLYDSKAIAGVAHRYLSGRVALKFDEFSGGENDTASRLRELGFEVKGSDEQLANVPTFEPGGIYNRLRDIHDVYGGQRQGGISTPKSAPLIFLFTGETGDQYGYHDGPRNDGTFAYTGEGQVGDMEFVRGKLQRLLTDVKARKVDVIVVYKVDRLTRSLADFAKLVELFDSHSVSFVSVTQQFNTTTSMGRLTLNVLLSFAQFEREVTSERIRDKIAASKRKGIWVGGMVPLGYQVKNRKVVVIKSEANIVRTIFKRYLELGSLNLLMQDLRQRQILTKVRRLSSGRAVGGNPLTRGPLAHLLRNRFYVGEVAFKGEVFPGEQPAILDRKLFESVQCKLDEQRTNHSTKRTTSESLLIGRIFDDRGNRMTPSYTSKNGKRYRYYLSSPLVQGQPERAGFVRRVPAPEIETLVIDAVRKRFKDSTAVTDCDLVNTYVARVEVQATRLAIKLVRKGNRKANRKTDNATFYIPWKKNALRRRREIIAPISAGNDIRPIRSETRVALVTSIACGRRWLDEICTGSVSDVEEIATREKCSVRQVNMTISLAFLSPTLVNAAIDGRLPRGIGIARLRDAPAEWSRQHALLGLAS